MNVKLDIFVAFVCVSLSTQLSFKIPDLEYNYKLMDTIMEHGKDLSSINLLIRNETGPMEDFMKPVIDFFTEGCPKLKNLTLESLRGWKDDTDFKTKLAELLSEYETVWPDIKKKDFSQLWDLSISKESLEALYKGCKELKDLKFTKIGFWDVFTDDEVKEILPNCNVEIKECHYVDPDL